MEDNRSSSEMAGGGKLDRFTKRARHALARAASEAKRLNHSSIGTEHILLGLVRQKDCTAVAILRELGLDPDWIIRALERAAKRGDRITLREPELTPRTKRVIEYSFEEARLMGQDYVGTEHLLLAILREGEGIASDILRGMGLDLEQVRMKTAETVMERKAKMRAATEPAKEKGESKTPLLDQLAVDLTVQAREGKLDPVIGREKEIERVIQILSRRTKNNPALIGEPGVGKTAIVEGLAQRIVAGEVPQTLLNKRLLMLDVGSLVAGTMYRGQFEERLKKVLEEIKQTECIIFIDEVHMLVGAGSAGSAVDAANILKPALGRGEIQCIGATTLDEYRKHIEGDAALERRFQPILVEEPTMEETLEILKGIRERYEAHHNVHITDEALEAAVKLSARYIPDRFMPDKAIDVIDEAASRVRIYKSPYAIGLRESFRQLRELERRRQEACEQERWDLVADLRVREAELDQRIEEMRLNWDSPFERPSVMPDDVAEIVSMWTGIPVKRLATEETERLLKMEEVLHQRIVGQDEPIAAVAKAVRRARAGLKDPRRPIGTFMFLGPTGVGKTELARALAEFLFGSEDALLKLDMSEFMERHTVSRLVGAPPGYVGYEEAGQLTEAVRRRPYSVVLFDEIEKAHPEVFNMLLQIMEDGHLTDAKGRRVDFRNTIIIMTSNVGATSIRKAGSLGFAVARDEKERVERDYEEMKEKVMDELKKTFRPEFLNRLDGVMVFHSLSKEQIKQIVDLELGKLQKRLDEHHVKLAPTEAARELIAEKGYDPMFGARPLRRVIQDLIEDRLSEGLLAGEFTEHCTVELDVENDELVMRCQPTEGAGDTSNGQASEDSRLEPFILRN
ncbi:MAG: ATP-dependent Clp protease ATP-binding subunit [Anaerolineae bacterium]